MISNGYVGSEITTALRRYHMCFITEMAADLTLHYIETYFKCLLTEFNKCL